MAGFVQIIEFTTSRPDEVRALSERYREQRAADGAIPVSRILLTEDRHRPGTYFTIVEFPSYDVAMANSSSPETTAFAASMAELCDGPPRFYDLDVRDTFLNLAAQQLARHVSPTLP